MTKRTAGGPKPPGIPDTSHVSVASSTAATADVVEALKAQIEELTSQLALSETARSEAEKAALAAAEAQGMLMQREIQEVATGKTIKVQRAVTKEGKPAYKVVGYKDDGREILRPVFRAVEIPTYFYKIDMPPVGGMCVRLGDVELYQGVVYELDLDTLRTVKEMIYRLWDHERNIHGSDENFYRPKESPAFSMRTGQRLR